MWTLVQIAVALLVLLVASLWLRRRVESQTLGPGGRSVRLTAEHAVHVVNVDGRRWMIGTGPGGAPTVLAELSDEKAALESPVTREAAPTLGASGPALGVSGG